MLEVPSFRRHTKSSVWPPGVITSPKMLSAKMKVFSSVSLLVPGSCFYWASGIFRWRDLHAPLNAVSQTCVFISICEKLVEDSEDARGKTGCRQTMLQPLEMLHCRSSAVILCLCSSSVQWKKSLQIETWSFSCNQNDPYFPTWSNIISCYSHMQFVHDNVNLTVFSVKPWALYCQGCLLAGGYCWQVDARVF